MGEHGLNGALVRAFFQARPVQRQAAKPLTSVGCEELANWKVVFLAGLDILNAVPDLVGQVLGHMKIRNGVDWKN